MYAPDGARSEADVVNLGYVLNVIEDPAERLETQFVGPSAHELCSRLRQAGRTDLVDVIVLDSARPTDASPNERIQLTRGADD